MKELISFITAIYTQRKNNLITYPPFFLLFIFNIFTLQLNHPVAKIDKKLIYTHYI